MATFLIADDHTIVRRGIRQILLDGFPDAQIDEVADAESIIKQVMHNSYDVIISDLSMPGRNGLEVLPQLKEIIPDTPVLIISIHPEDHYAIRVLKSGASGYLSKDLAPDELVSAVKRVMLGKRYITPAVAEKMASNLDEKKQQAPHHYLSDREFSVFKLLSSGKSITEIAESLFLSPTTVSTYRSRILAKMNFKNNAELTVYALEHKLIPSV